MGMYNKEKERHNKNDPGGDFTSVERKIFLSQVTKW